MENIIAKYLKITLEEYIQEEGRSEYDYYYSFLVTTDYIPNKLIEYQSLGIDCSDYTKELQARQYARDKINELNMERMVFYQ